MVLMVAFVLFLALIIAFNAINKMLADDESAMKFQIAIVGQAGDSYLNMGITALQTFDSSRFAVDILQMSEQEARAALGNGSIGAYVVIPDGFVEDALHGRVQTIKFVSSVGASGLVSLFKEEITKVVSEIVVACQRGMYGIDAVLTEAGYAAEIGRLMNDVSISYAEFVLVRSQIYSVESLQIHDGLGMEGSLFCGIGILLICLCILPFGYLYMKDDMSFDKLLLSKGYTVFGIVLKEFAAFVLGSAFVLMTLLAISAPFSLKWLSGLMNVRSVLGLIPVIFMLCALDYLLFQFSGNLINGTLYCFFATLVLCFAGGCLYPLYFFPSSVHKVLSWIPHCLAKEQVAACLSVRGGAQSNPVILGYGLVFLLGALMVRNYRIKADER